MYTAQSGLNSAQSALYVTGNNLSNAMTTGYSRQSIILGEAGGRSTGYGFFGYGSQVIGVERAYNSFVNNNVRSASMEYNALAGRYGQLSQIDNMLGDDTSNISISLSNTFIALETLSSDPVSLAARAEVLSQLQATSYLFKSNSSTLNGLEKSTNAQITQTVKDINSCSQQLAELNKSITKVYNQTGTLPADLLDQRDLLLDELNSLVGIKVTEDPVNGSVNVTMTNGMPLVSGDRYYTLSASQSPEDPSKTVVSYIDAAGNALPLDESKMTTGTLGGLFKFRNEDLVDARNQLDQMALQMANRFNEVNKQGYDLYGEPGKDIFSIADPIAIANLNNQGDSSLSVSFTDISSVNAQDYTVKFDGNEWVVKTSDGTTVPTTVGPNGEIEFDGISIMPQGTPQAGDSFKLNPVSGAASNISVAITEGSQIAASSSPDPSEESNNENLKLMLGIKDEKLIDGTYTLTEAYAGLVSSIGSSMKSLEASLKTSGASYQEALYQKQSVSGVDMNEEFVNLQMYTQYYQANAQVLETAVTIFDTILSIR
jgi:flagellar hook-associated protein 1 FlgK